MLFQSDVLYIFSVTSFIFSAVLSASEGGCVLNVTNFSTEKYVPVSLYNFSSHYELVVPNKGFINLKRGAKITLICPGSRNYIKLANSNITSVSCVQDSLVKIFSTTYDFTLLQCHKSPKSDVLKTSEKCGNKKGYIYQIGYQVTKRDRVNIINVCYIPEIGSTLYTHHVIHGNEMKYASKAKSRPDFSTSGLNNAVAASLAYKKTFQKSTFNKILDSAKLADNYINDKSFLARGHLSPDADFLLASSQYSTYYYINTAPQWQDVNGGNWKSIEFTVRKLSESYKNLDIYTGTHDILIYEDKNEDPQPIFLGLRNKLPVPKYFWKIAYDQVTQKGIVFVILNDPFVGNVEESDIFCEDICDDYGYTNLAWKRVNKGYVFCCHVPDFQSVISVAPTLKIRGIISI